MSVKPGQRARGYRWQDVGLLVAWMATIFLLSSQPKLPNLPSPWYEHWPSILAHVLEYAALAFLWWRALAPGRKIDLKLTFLIGLFTFGYALSDEWHQSFVPNRKADPLDLVYDGLGALVALLLIWLRSRGTGPDRQIL